MTNPQSSIDAVKDSRETDDSKRGLISIEDTHDAQAKRAATYQYHIQRPLTSDSMEVDNTLEKVDIDQKNQQEQEDKRPVLYKMYVKPGVTKANLWMLFLVKAGIYILATFWNVALVDTLKMPEYYDVPDDQIGRQSSYLLCGAYPAGFIGTLMAGYIFDTYGRRVPLALSFGACSVTLFFVLLPAPDIYPWLFILRCLFQFLLSGPWAVPLAADYVDPESMAKASIFGTLGMMAGNLFAYGVLLQLAVYIPDEQITYSITASTGLIIAVMLYIWVQEMKFRDQEDVPGAADVGDAEMNQEIAEAKKHAKRAGSLLQEKRQARTNSYASAGNRSAVSAASSRGVPEAEFKQLTTCQQIKALSMQVCDACGKNNKITLGIIGGGIVRCYNVFHNTFQFLFVSSFVEKGVYSQEEATLFYSYQTLISLNIGIFVAVPMAIVMDKYDPRKTVWPIFAFRGATCVAYCFVQDPSRWPTYVLQTFLFGAQTGEIVAIDALLLRNAEKEIRGMIVGIQMGCSFLAQFLFALFGGFLFDLVGAWTPFAMLACMDFGFVFTLLCMSYVCKTFTNDIEERRLAKEEAERNVVGNSAFQTKKPMSMVDRTSSINSDFKMQAGF